MYQTNFCFCCKLFQFIQQENKNCNKDPKWIIIKPDQTIKMKMMNDIKFLLEIFCKKKKKNEIKIKTMNRSFVVVVFGTLYE